MNDALAAYADATIRAGSKSFAAAARLFDRDTRESATLLYAWCRHCDDVIDGQTLGHGQTSGDRGGARERLALLEDLTRRAYAGETMTDPAFAAFQRVARRHAIPVRHALDHLAGFRMDVDGRRYSAIEDTLAYCYHVAGVVGVMMAMVMGVRDEATLDRAADLGIAFQLSNIARDVVEDAAIGRVYLPETWLAETGVAGDRVGERDQRAAVARVVARLLDVAETYYDSAAVGIGALPWRSAWAIATARDVYRRIGRQVRAQGAAAWDSRTVTTKVAKAASVARGLSHAALSRAQAGPARPDGLWTRPR